MSREMLDGGPLQPRHGRAQDRLVGADDEFQVFDVSSLGAGIDDPGPLPRPRSRRVLAGATAVVLALGLGWILVGNAKQPGASSSASTPAPSMTPTSGWFAYSGSGYSGYSSNLTLQGVPNDLSQVHSRFEGTFPATPTTSVTAYRLTASRGESVPPPELTRQSLIAAANIPLASANLLTTTNMSTGLDTYAIENPPPHAITDGPLKVSGTAAIGVARAILAAVGADPTQWQITTNSRVGDGWALDLTLDFPGVEELAAQSPIAGALPHGTLIVTTTADTPGARPGALAVQALNLTSGYLTTQGTVSVRPAAETFSDLSAGRFQLLPGQQLPRADRLYDYATESLTLIPAPYAGRLHDQDAVHRAHLLVPAWIYTHEQATLPDPSKSLIASAVPPKTLLFGIPVGRPYASNPGD